jgi:hypothetical protein
MLFTKDSLALDGWVKKPVGRGLWLPKTIWHLSETGQGIHYKITDQRPRGLKAKKCSFLDSIAAKDGLKRGKPGFRILELICSLSEV